MYYSKTITTIVISLIILFLSEKIAFAENISLREKIGQMLIFGFEGKTVTAQSPIVKAIENNNIGGVVLFDYDYQKKTYDKNIESPNQLKRLNEDLQRFTLQSNVKHHRPLLPLLIGVDYEGGRVNRLGERYGFPKTFSAVEVSKKSTRETKKIAANMAKTLKNMNFNLDFSPVLDVNINLQNPIIGKKDRSFSSDPKIVAHYAAIYANAFRKQGIQCAYKHFPGHGSAIDDSHIDFVDITKTWKVKELKPYKLLLNKKSSCGMVMTGHVINRKLDPSGLPATLSSQILTNLLRKQLKFNGVIVTDDMQMAAIRDHYTLEQSVTKAINAGADMLIFANTVSEKIKDPTIIVDIVANKVKNGKIKKSRIEKAYQRIKSLKQTIINKE